MDEKDAGSQPILKAHWVRVQFALTVPCVLDRFVQQAVLQVLQKRWDPTFSEHSHGFRPGGAGRGEAGARGAAYIAEGHRWWWISTWRNFSIESITTA